MVLRGKKKSYHPDLATTVGSFDVIRLGPPDVSTLPQPATRKARGRKDWGGGKKRERERERERERKSGVDVAKIEKGLFSVSRRQIGKRGLDSTQDI